MRGRYGHETDLDEGLRVPLIWGPGALANGLYKLRDLMGSEPSYADLGYADLGSEPKRSVHGDSTASGAAPCSSMSEDA